MGKSQNFEDRLKEAFELGYSSATQSLIQLTKNKIYFNNFHIGSHKLDQDSLADPPYANKHCKMNVLITTEIFGEMVGKSYLVLSSEEFDLLTKDIPDSKDMTLNLKEDFVKEVDNILSASVITKLSNELNLKMYGDVPLLIGKVNSKIEDIIFDDFSESVDEVYVNSIYFSFEKDPSIRPLFIWVMNRSILQDVQVK